MSEGWKRQRSSEQRDLATKNSNDTTDHDGSGAAAPQEQRATPTASSKADNDSDSDIEVLCSPVYKGLRRDSGSSASRKKGSATRARG